MTPGRTTSVTSYPNNTLRISSIRALSKVRKMRRERGRTSWRKASRAGATMPRSSLPRRMHSSSSSNRRATPTSNNRAMAIGVRGVLPSRPYARPLPLATLVWSLWTSTRLARGPLPPSTAIAARNPVTLLPTVPSELTFALYWPTNASLCIRTC